MKQQSRCPECNYALVLLERRHKYKCAKCGRLFSKQEIGLKEFREYNQVERKKARKQYKIESSQNQLARKTIPKIIEELKNPKPQKPQAEQKREYRKNLSEQAKKEENEKRKARRMKNLESTRLNGRIEYWKQKQKALALLYCDFYGFKASRFQKRESLPTISLS
jgi:DNA-directed RNA polymerase subunit RPC12/RpoP